MRNKEMFVEKKRLKEERANRLKEFFDNKNQEVMDFKS